MPDFEVRCLNCDVSFPVGTKRCLHCGGRVGASGRSIPELGDSLSTLFPEAGTEEDATHGREAMGPLARRLARADSAEDAAAVAAGGQFHFRVEGAPRRAVPQPAAHLGRVEHQSLPVKIGVIHA